MSRGLKAYPNKTVVEMRENSKPIVPGKCMKLLPDNVTVHQCSRIYNETTCKCYQDPSTQWRLGDCPMADDELREYVEVEETGKVRLGQQKQKKKR